MRNGSHWLARRGRAGGKHGTDLEFTPQPRPRDAQNGRRVVQMLQPHCLVLHELRVSARPSRPHLDIHCSQRIVLGGFMPLNCPQRATAKWGGIGQCTFSLIS
jgi:hypothetical protein